MNVSTELVATLCTTYNISTEWILTGNGDMLKIEGQVSQPIIAEREPAFEAGKLIDYLRADCEKKDVEIHKLEQELSKAHREIKELLKTQRQQQGKAPAKKAKSPDKEHARL